MARLALVLTISLGTIVAGYVIQRLVQRTGGGRSAERIASSSRALKLGAFFVMNPVAVLSTFWAIELPAPSVLVLPLLGLFSVFVGLGGALAATRLVSAPPKRAASIFTCGVFSNVLTIGGLVCYAMFREPGYALVQLFTMFMSPVYYLVGYPISSNIAHERRPVFRLSLDNIRENPFLAIPLLAMALGVGMRLTGLPRPQFLGSVVAVLVPCVAGTLGLSIGLTLRPARIGSYKREVAIILSIRHLLVPVVMIPLGWLLGFGSIAGGLPLKVLTVLSFMPVAFNALVPPAIYGFDLDLANSAWILSTGSLLIIVPVLFLIL